MDYDDFLMRKAQIKSMDGFDPIFMPSFLFDYQAALVEWSVRQGRGALFADCGLGKTPMELVWAENVVRKTNGNVLLLTPLAVSLQIVAEAEKFGIDAKRSRDGIPHRGITVSNYEKLHLFNPDDFVGIVCDESSILKSMDGATKTLIVKFARKLKYRLLATATAAPNDFHELGTSSEALGFMGAMDMLNKFFKNANNDSKTGKSRGQVVKWRMKGHAEEQFWRYITSWARAMRKPSDMGFDDGKLLLPELTELEHVLDYEFIPDGQMFPVIACGLGEQREERRRTLNLRCEKIGSLVNDTGQPALVWCQMNDEGDQLERDIPDSVQVSGRDSDEAKEEKLMAFASGQARVLVTKPKIGAWGLNFQHCNHITFFPSHSYEQYYQGVRRCWRFGQKKPVHVDIVTTHGEVDVLKNLQRKQKNADIMFGNLILHMNNALGIIQSNDHTKTQGVPSWL